MENFIFIVLTAVIVWNVVVFGLDKYLTLKDSKKKNKKGGDENVQQTENS